MNNYLGDNMSDPIQRIVIVGGGANNKNLINRLKKLFGKIICVSDDIGLSSKSVEAELMAYLAIRSLYKLPITFPKTTLLYSHSI